MLDKKLKERLFNTYIFSNHNNNKFILLFLKVAYPYEYIDNWEKFNEPSLPGKEDCYSHLNMEDITDADYGNAKRVCKDFEINNLEEYHGLYVQSDTLLLTNIIENIGNICISIYEFDIDMLLMVEKGGEICHSVYWYAKANNKCMKDYNKNKESPYIQYWDINNLYGWAMSQELPVNGLEWIKDSS